MKIPVSSVEDTTDIVAIESALWLAFYGQTTSRAWVAHGALVEFRHHGERWFGLARTTCATKTSFAVDTFDEEGRKASRHVNPSDIVKIHR